VRERNGEPAMTGRFLVIVGCIGMALDRCWERLCTSRWYSWKSNFVKSLEALFKENSWSVDLKHAMYWLKPGPLLVLERQHVYVQSERVAEQYKALRRSTRSLYLPGSSGRFLSDR
jgi:hypothetical protein